MNNIWHLLICCCTQFWGSWNGKIVANYAIISDSGNSGPIHINRLPNSWELTYLALSRLKVYPITGYPNSTRRVCKDKPNITTPINTKQTRNCPALLHAITTTFTTSSTATTSTPTDYLIVTNYYLLPATTCYYYLLPTTATYLLRLSTCLPTY